MEGTKKKKVPLKTKVIGGTVVAALAAGGLGLSNTSNTDTSTKKEVSTTQGSRTTGGNDISVNVNTGDITTKEAVTFGTTTPSNKAE